MLLAGGVVGELVGGEATYSEVVGVGVSEVVSGDGGGGPDGVVLGEACTDGSLGVEEVPEGGFFGVVGTGGVAGRGSDAAVVFLD